MGKPNRKRRFRAIPQAILQAICFQTLKANRALSARARSHHGPIRRCPQIPVGDSSCLITLWCRWTFSRISTTRLSFPLTTIHSPQMAQLNRRRFNKPRPSRKARRSNSRQREPVNPMLVRRLQAMVSAPLEAPPTRLWIEAQPKPLPLAATLIRRQQTLFHQTVARFPCVMKMVWLTAMFMEKSPLASHQQALRLLLPTVISRSPPLTTPNSRILVGFMDIR
jgi:hypothetical protein